MLIICFVIVIVVIGSENGCKEILMIIVLNGMLGFIVEVFYDKVGWNVLDMYLLIFDGVWVLVVNLVGEWGSGFCNFFSILDEGWIVIVVFFIGVVEGCLEVVVDYVKSCMIFGSVFSMW